MTVKAIAFDLWETLITDTPELSRRQERHRLDRIEEILRRRGLADLAEEIERAHRRLWHRCQELYWSVDRDIPCRTQIEHFLEELELDATGFDEPTLAELEHVYAHAAVEILPEIVPGAPDVLREIKRRGLATGLISNTGRTPGYALRAALQKLDLAPLIDVMVFSNEHGRCKPEPSIFEALQSGLAVRGEEMIFVGDNLYVDVHGAQNAGMRAIHFAPSRRGTAVAPDVDHGKRIVADLVVTDLRQIPAAIDLLTGAAAR
jgi:HAD superfamily hydrolase (TIGR01549 family)